MKQLTQTCVKRKKARHIQLFHQALVFSYQGFDTLIVASRFWHLVARNWKIFFHNMCWHQSIKTKSSDCSLLHSYEWLSNSPLSKMQKDQHTFKFGPSDTKFLSIKFLLHIGVTTPWSLHQGFDTLFLLHIGVTTPLSLHQGFDTLFLLHIGVTTPWSLHQGYDTLFLLHIRVTTPWSLHQGYDILFLLHIGVTTPWSLHQGSDTLFLLHIGVTTPWSLHQGYDTLFLLHIGVTTP